MKGRTFALLAAFLALPAASFAQGPMTVEKVHDGLAIAPDVEVSRVGSTTATMAGVYGGWMIQNTVLIGAGGYWQTNRSEPRRIDYGGAVIEWLDHTAGSFGFGARALIGGGEARLTSNGTLPLDRFGRVELNQFFDQFGFAFPFDTRVSTASGQLVFRQDFFIFEPQVDGLVNLGPHLRVRIGAGYRVIGAPRGWSDQLRGPSASVALQIGGSSSTRVRQ
jgi:hypothetical protein